MRFKPLSAIAAAASMAVLATVSAAANAQSNLLVDLGDGPGFGISNIGQVALEKSFYTNGTLTPYPSATVGGLVFSFTLPALQSITGATINASGQVAGIVGNDAGVYSNGVVTDILPRQSPADPSLALGISDSGIVVGIARVSLAFKYGVIFDGAGSYTGIGYLCGVYCVPGDVLSTARAVNDAGIVTGDAKKDMPNPNPSGTNVLGSHAILYDHGTLTDLFPGVGYAINASGQIAGRKDDISIDAQVPGHAFLYTAGTTLDLGVLPGGTTSVGYALNAAGQVVGASALAGSTGTHAFFYNGVINDLNSFVGASDPLKPFVTLTEARGINDNRLIVANGVDSRTGLTHAYLLQAPWLDVTPGNLVFPSQPDGSVSSQQSVTLTNSGAAQLALNSVSASGDFTQTSSCGATLAPGGKCTVMVAFEPTALGDRTGNLTVQTNGAAIIIPLSGVASIKLSISSTATATTTGTPVTLTWAASSGVTCSATGGSTADSWTGMIAASGTQAVTETAAGTYLYGLTCTAGSQMTKAQVSVVVSLAPATTPTTSGGGGAFDLLSLVSLTAAAGLRGTRRRLAGRRNVAHGRASSALVSMRQFASSLCSSSSLTKVWCRSERAAARSSFGSTTSEVSRTTRTHCSALSSSCMRS